MFPLYDPMVGWALLCAYGLLTFAIINKFTYRYDKDRVSFLLARRELTWFTGALSIAAAWLWAPGLFISTQQAYVNGLPGLFWFCLGNFLTLMFFAGFAHRLRKQSPEGFTISGHIKEKFGDKAHFIYQVEMLAIAVCAVAINLVAGATTVALLTNIDYNMSVVAMVLIALSYTFLKGYKATVVTEIIKVGVVYTVVGIIVALIASRVGNDPMLSISLDGINAGGDGSITSSFGWGVFTSFGIAAFIGHMAGPWRDNNFYQRAFAIKPNHIAPAYILAAFMFILVPLAMGFIGFVAAGSGIVVPEGDIFNVNLYTIATILPKEAGLLFTFAIFAGLISIMDSQMTSVANIVGSDYADRFNFKGRSRLAMFIVAAIGIAVAVSGFSIGQLFLFFSIMGACVFIPTLIAISFPHLLTGKGLFYGVIGGFIPAISLYFFGEVLYATLTGVILPPVIALAWSRRS